MIGRGQNMLNTNTALIDIRDILDGWEIAIGKEKVTHIDKPIHSASLLYTVCTSEMNCELF